MDADYLKSTVGDALAAALTSLAMKQPKDPVDFLGHYLATYANHLEGEKKVGEEPSQQPTYSPIYACIP